METYLVSVSEAAKLLNQANTTVENSLRVGVAPFGYAVKLGQWKYVISRAKLYDFLGIPYVWDRENGGIKKALQEAGTSQSATN